MRTDQPCYLFWARPALRLAVGGVGFVPTLIRKALWKFDFSGPFSTLGMERVLGASTHRAHPFCDPSCSLTAPEA